MTPINRGWLNLKWKLNTTQGAFLLKEYNQERLKLYDVADLQRALQLQQTLHSEGLLCPKLLAHDGQLMHVTNQNRRFVVMAFHEGTMITAGKMNEAQMYELGCQTGKMHRLLQRQSIRNAKPQFLPPSKEERLQHWTALYQEAQMAEQCRLVFFIELQLKATEALDVSSLLTCEKGLAHRDLWVDNMLFYENRLTAILDFDRLKYDYPELDLARAILSGSLLDEAFSVENAVAFLNGYRTEHPFPVGHLERAMRMLWYMESTWWITGGMDQHSVSPARFAHEMVWLSKVHSELEEMVGGL
ncbi:hypothetical protein A374_14345 [Fictibacillus macauensis ZFHKF-1]|uniref:Aminoglycoside phosphotransferase domain-containing protein n=1 Tax=Fictibacillus macauensis ZFHKF-1 TaxID=1196324 RepID=I8AHF7_9BACL|nr:hypothetical protein A374_14345 [Fictibacillus macauensis ZFHKF-1]